MHDTSSELKARIGLKSGFLPVLVAGVMPIIMLSILITGIGLRLVEWQPPQLWEAQFGTTGINIHNGVTAVSADNSGLFFGGFVGQTFVAGVFPSPSNLFLSRYDFTGQRAWIRYFGNASTDQVMGVAVSSAGAYVAGQENDSSFLRSYDQNGNAGWTTGLLQSGSEATGISAGDGTLYAAFDFYSASTTNYTLVLRSYDSTGNTRWTENLGNFTSTTALHVFAGPRGPFLTGSDPLPFLQSYNASGSLQWSRQLACNCVPADVGADSSSIYTAGVLGQGGSFDGFLGKYDLNGNPIWSKDIDPPDLTSVVAFRMSVSQSAIYTVMNTNRFGYIMSYDNNGNQIWSVQTQEVLNTVLGRDSGVLVGGKKGSLAWISEFSQSSSLVLFGINPPFSFGLVGVLVGISAISLLWFRKQRRGSARPRPFSPRPKQSPEDPTLFPRRVS